MILNVHEVYLDYNASAPVLPAVQKAIAEVQAEHFGNPSSLHTRGRAARGLIEQARAQVAAGLGARADQLYFTSGATEANNAVVKGVVSAAALRRGIERCHVVTTLIEHDSVLGPCKQLEAMGARVTYLPAGPDGRVRPADLAAALTADTVLVSIMHGNNETGAIQPVGELIPLAMAAGVPFHTDAVQTFGKIPVEVGALGCEYLTISSHKLGGPKGAGAIYARGNAAWLPLVAGGDQERGQRTGTENTAAIVGFGKAAELAVAHRATEHARLSALRTELLAGLPDVAPGAIVNQAAREHQLPGTLNLTFPGHESIHVLAGLDCHEIAASVGSACTADRVEPSHVLLGMGIDRQRALESIRLSMGAGTTSKQVRYALDVLGEVLAHPPAGLAYLDPAHLTAARIASPRTVVVDLRFPHERWRSPSIAGAREWNILTFDRRARELPRDAEVILMCATGVVSYGAGYRLARAGHPTVRVVQGGYNAWRALNPGAQIGAP
jgi:cysteine desulfurase